MLKTSRSVRANENAPSLLVQRPKLSGAALITPVASLYFNSLALPCYNISHP